MINDREKAEFTETKPNTCSYFYLDLLYSPRHLFIEILLVTNVFSVRNKMFNLMFVSEMVTSAQ